MEHGMVINILLLMVSGVLLYIIIGLFFKSNKPVKRRNSGIWVKRATPSTKVAIINMDAKTVEYYYTHVNGNQVAGRKIYKDSLNNFKRTFMQK